MPAAPDREPHLRLLRPEDDLVDVGGRDRLDHTERVDAVEALLVDDAGLLIRGARRGEYRALDELLERLQPRIDGARSIADKLPAGEGDHQPGTAAEQHPTVEYLSSATARSHGASTSRVSAPNGPAAWQRHELCSPVDAHEARSGELPGVRDDPRRVEAEPLLEQRDVDAAEVGGRLEVAVGVEPVREAGELADHPAGRSRADQERGAGGAVVGAVRAVLLRAAAELRPDEREHAVGDAASLEIALEGEQRLRGESKAVESDGRLVGVRVVLAARLERDAAQRQPRGDHRGEPGEVLREACRSSAGR